MHYRKIDLEQTSDYFSLNKKTPFIATGPCAIESIEQIEQSIDFFSSNHINYIRTFPYKVRTSPYDYQGIGDDILPTIKKLKIKYNIKTIAEIYSQKQLEKCIDTIDIIQIGTRFMYHRELLSDLGKINKPIILKRGFNATIQEWLLSAEFYLLEGGHNLLLCDRGIRTFENSHRNSFDITSILAVREMSDIPVIVDPSHILGKRDGISKIVKSALVAGFDGFIFESHPDPKNALSDKDQQLNFTQAAELINDINNFYKKLL